MRFLALILCLAWSDFALAQGGPPSRICVISAVESDPLAGISFAIRLQTCKGFGQNKWAPLGLYKDTDCTQPATTAGDSIAAWRDELSGSGLVAIQGTGSKRPTLAFVAGRPVLRTDGVDDYLAVSAPASAPFALIISCLITSHGSYALIAAYDDGMGDWNRGAGISIVPTDILRGWSEEYAHHFVNSIIPSSGTIGVAFDTDNVSLWVNGTSVGSTSAGTPVYTGASLFIGGDTFGQCIGADIDHVLVSNPESIGVIMQKLQ